MSASPTHLTMQRLENDGWTADIVERRITKRVTKDFLGFIDVLAIDDDKILAVQATAASQGKSSNHNARVRKAKASPLLAKWLAHPSRTFEVWSWFPGGMDVRRECVTTNAEAGDGKA